MTWSYSRLTSFQDCPYKWFLTYISGDKETPMFYASYGSFVHRLIERYYSGELKKEQLTGAFLLGFQTEVQGERPAASTVAKYITAGAQYFQNFKPFPFKPIAVEDQLYFTVEGLPFTAIIDFLGERDGKLAVVDNKSRELKPRSSRVDKPTVKDRELDEMLRQLYIYAEGIYQKYGEYPKKLCFNCFRNGQFIEEPFNRRVCIQTVDWARKTAEEIAKTEDFHPEVDYFHCRYLCGHHNECIYYQNR